jgi:hypothetical protein
MGQYSKTITAAVGVLVLFGTTYLPTGYDHWLQLIVGLLTALGVYGVTNAAPPVVVSTPPPPVPPAQG